MQGRPGLQDASFTSWQAKAGSVQSGRQLLACDLKFQAKKNTERLPLDYRLATIQDVKGKSLDGVLNDGDTALLVDGWVSYSEIRMRPIQSTGSAASPHASKLAANRYVSCPAYTA